MLPYLHFQYLAIGPVKIYTWGFFVALGFLAALALLIKRHPQEKDIFIDLILSILIGAIIGARAFFILFYSDARALNMGMLKIWEGGMSSMGGIFGGISAAYLYARYKKINFYGLAQKLAFVLPLGLAIGRIGCALINEHPGIKTWAHPLSVAYPDGPRFELGLLEMIFDALIFIYFLALLKKYPKRKHLFLEQFLIIFGIGRFLMDFLRVGEPKVAGLIPSQYGTIIMAVIGIYLLIKNRHLIIK